MADAAGRKAFVDGFNASLKKLKTAEKVTREVLMHLSRDLLAALHGKDGLLYGDIQYVNAVLPVLTPVNKKVYVLFMKHFTGFHFDDDLQVFTKKSKKRADEAQQNALALLEDPNQNIWTWAERHVEVEAKPFTAEKVTEFIIKATKKMAGDQVAVLRAVMAGGITPAALAVILQEMGGVENVEPAPAIEPAPF
jgi:hypothetical protein